YFNVTAYANQTENPGSTLAMQILTRTFYVGGPAGHYYDGGYVQTIVEMTIHGHFASNLHPGLLMFTINQTGQQNGKGLDFIWSTPAEQRGTNVTFDHNQELTFFGTGTATGLETLVNDIGGERTVNPGDNFRVTGNNLPLSPAATLYTFYLLWSDGSLIQQKSWSTP